MKRLTVAAAALAAGMLTIVAQSQAESDRNMFHKPAGKVAAADRKAEKPAEGCRSQGREACGCRPQGREACGRQTQGRADCAGRKAEERLPTKAEKVAAADRKAEKPVAKDVAAKGAKRVASLASQDGKDRQAQGEGSWRRYAEDSVDRPRAARPQGDGAQEREGSRTASPAGNSVASAATYTTLVSRYAAAYGVPVSLAHAVISVESNYRPNIRGSAGEIGLMQIKPATARMMGYTGNTKRPVQSRDQHQIRDEVSRPCAPAVGRHDLRHDPALQCRPCGQAHEPGFGGLLLEGEAASGRRLRQGLGRGDLVLRFSQQTPLSRLPAGRAAAPARAERLRVRKVRAPWKYGAG